MKPPPPVTSTLTADSRSARRQRTLHASTPFVRAIRRLPVPIPLEQPAIYLVARHPVLPVGPLVVQPDPAERVNPPPSPGDPQRCSEPTGLHLPRDIEVEFPVWMIRRDRELRQIELDAVPPAPSKIPIDPARQRVEIGEVGPAVAKRWLRQRRSAAREGIVPVEVHARWPAIWEPHRPDELSRAHIAGSERVPADDNVPGALSLQARVRGVKDAGIATRAGGLERG